MNVGSAPSQAGHDHKVAGTERPSCFE